MEARHGLVSSMASIFAIPAASRAINGSSNGAERAFRHSSYRNIQAERELLFIDRDLSRERESSEQFVCYGETEMQLRRGAMTPSIQAA